jgi:1,4-dihydroxy-2-naphthoyl-CoA synthase
MGEARAWARDVAALSPTAIKFLKQSFNIDSEVHGGISALAGSALELYVQTAEAREGALSFVEKRTPDFTSVLAAEPHESGNGAPSHRL